MHSSVIHVSARCGPGQGQEKHGQVEAHVLPARANPRDMWWCWWQPGTVGRPAWGRPLVYILVQMLLAGPSGALVGKCVRMALFLKGVSGWLWGTGSSVWGRAGLSLQNDRQGGRLGLGLGLVLS